MKGDYTAKGGLPDATIVQDDPQMKGDYTVPPVPPRGGDVRDDPQMKETYTLRCFATLSMTIGGLG